MKPAACSRPALVSIAVSAITALPAPAQQVCDFDPVARETILNTDFSQVSYTNCLPRNVAGGVFEFRNVNIRAGVTVRGIGSNPLILIATGTVTIDGELSARGGNGARVDTLNSANFSTPGGIGGPGGGRGGVGNPNTTRRSFAAQAGSGPLSGLGGVGGQLACGTPGARGSGGGGGSFATQGDPYYPFQASGTSFVQQLGRGGFGGPGASGSATRTLPGGLAGVIPFRDGRADNDFFGLAFDVFARRPIEGELRWPVGGQGGGGGGNRSVTCDDPAVAWINDNCGGGGGAGGGALVVVALGALRIGATGRVHADGGHGGGGEQAGSNNQGAGGGGGSGGMVVLFSPTGIEITAHGETYANGDYNFPISADGGVSLVGAYGGQEVTGKYPPMPGTYFDASPSGGFGGLGVVQLFTIPGANVDGTNTVLDDNVHILRQGQRLTGAEKQRYLAWRGFPNGLGVPVDDAGRPTAIGSNEGDIRPSPILLPILQ